MWKLLGIVGHSLWNAFVGKDLLVRFKYKYQTLWNKLWRIVQQLLLFSRTVQQGRKIIFFISQVPFKLLILACWQLKTYFISIIIHRPDDRLQHFNFCWMPRSLLPSRSFSYYFSKVLCWGMAQNYFETKNSKFKMWTKFYKYIFIST